MVGAEIPVQLHIQKSDLAQKEDLWHARDWRLLARAVHDQQIAGLFGDQHLVIGQECHRPGRTQAIHYRRDVIVHAVLIRRMRLARKDRMVVLLFRQPGIDRLAFHRLEQVLVGGIVALHQWNAVGRAGEWQLRQWLLQRSVNGALRIFRFLGGILRESGHRQRRQKGGAHHHLGSHVMSPFERPACFSGTAQAAKILGSLPLNAGSRW